MFGGDWLFGFATGIFFTISMIAFLIWYALRDREWPDGEDRPRCRLLRRLGKK